LKSLPFVNSRRSDIQSSRRIDVDISGWAFDNGIRDSLEEGIFKYILRQNCWHLQDN
jgi:hypothetical protein